MDKVIIKKSTIKGRIDAPPYKSHAIRLVFTSIATKNSIIIENYPRSRDFMAALNAARCLGSHVDFDDDRIFIDPPDNLTATCSSIDAGGSATVFRFSAALATHLPKDQSIVVTGDQTLIKRPIDELVESLKTLGCRVEFLSREQYPPIKVYGGGWKKRSIYITARKSSQHISALMIAGILGGGIDINIIGKTVSSGFIWLTYWVIISMEGYASITGNLSRISIAGSSRSLSRFRYRVIGDYTLAAYPIIGSYITEGSITRCGLDPPLKFPGDWSLFQYLEELGVKVIYRDSSKCFEGIVGELDGGSIDINSSPDLAPPLSILGAFSNNAVILEGITHLKYKESNRLETIVNTLRSFGVKALYKDSKLIIYPSKVKMAKIRCPSDHRIGMMSSILALVDGGVIENYRCVDKSWPEYWDVLRSLNVGMIFS